MGEVAQEMREQSPSCAVYVNIYVDDKRGAF